MSSLEGAPIYEKLAGDDGKATLPYILFFNELFSGDTGTGWSPIFSGLSITGGAPQVTGTYYQLGQFCIFEVHIIPGTSTTSTAGTTVITNFPLDMQFDGINFAVSNGGGSGSGMCAQASNLIYTPGWSALTTPVSIIGIVRAS